jgi:hypothetical protein
MSDIEVRSLDLRSAPAADPIMFKEAQWWDETSSLVVVSFYHSGELTKLRMDLDKRVFIDHLEDQKADSILRDFAPEISDIIGAWRYGSEISREYV